MGDRYSRNDWIRRYGSRDDARENACYPHDIFWAHHGGFAGRIVATAFANDIHRREFVVTWAMVAKVPLFAGLSAVQIAAIMKLLRAQRVEAGTIITRKGEDAHSMYFVAAGEVELHLHGRRLRVGAGHFFGEIAVIRKSRRSATVTAVTRTSLLTLAAEDVRVLMERDPMIAERMQEVARDHEHLQGKSRGDIALEELSSTEPDPTRESDPL